MPKNLSNVKEDILSVSRKLIKNTGYGELSIRKIASQCGVATGTVYNYYSSKNEIIAEILLNEWKLMLCRIDKNTKTSEEVIDKLELMFNELNYFMSNVHGYWFDSHSINNDSNFDVAKIKEKKKLLRNQLSEKIYSFVSNGKLTNDAAINLCDIISNILLSYSNEKHQFSKLKLSLNALISELKKY